MFKKLVSQLSLSPSAASGLAFYARRLKQEKITRTFSAIAAVLIVGLQVATILAPPTASNAASPSDIIYGGIVSKADLLNKYDSSAELQALYNRFGISRQDVVGSHETTINTRDHSLNSLGRVQHGSTDAEIKVGSHTYWSRYLYQFDTGSNIKNGSNYQVLEGYRSSDHGYFAIMFRCGNIVFRTLPKPPATPTPIPTPKPSRIPITTPVPTAKPKTPTPTPKKTATPKPTPTPNVSMICTKLEGSVAAGQTPLKVTYTGQGTATGQTLTEYEFDFGDSHTQNSTGPTVSHTYAAAGKFTATLRVKGSTGAVSPAAPACSFTLTTTAPPAAFTKGKSALNLTQNIDATTKPAHAGDIVRYTLTTKNVGGTAESYSVVEHIEDVLEYADVTDSTGATLSNGVMTWPAIVIQPGTTLTKTFTVTVKNPIPDTPAGISDPYSYDLRMDNIYGNTVRIQIQPPLPKQIEIASSQLPDTGAATSTIIILLVAGLTLFFYFRNRQLAAEVRLLRRDYEGGMHQ